ncbi:hydroxyacid dehydrogenase [Rhizobacter sp. P5_C2]
MKILITEFMDAPAVARLAAKHEVVHDATLVDHPARMIALASSVDAIIVRNRTQVRGELLAALTRCRVVGRLGVGLDNLDLAGCEARGIRVIPATGANAQSVAEYVIATAMLLLRGAYGSTAEVAAGTWPRAALTNGREIGGKTLGLIGYGSIGQLTGRLASLMGMQVVAHDAAMPAGSDVPSLTLEALLAQSDVVSLHVPLLDSTRHLINAQRLAAMKPGAVLINTARGGVVDEAALADALTAGRLAGAALDVFEAEPLPAGSPLAGCPNLLLTPHIAGVTAEANERVSSLIAEKVLEALA